jgi:hypothetical protein
MPSHIPFNPIGIIKFWTSPLPDGRHNEPITPVRRAAMLRRADG